MLVCVFLRALGTLQEADNHYSSGLLGSVTHDEAWQASFFGKRGGGDMFVQPHIMAWLHFGMFSLPYPQRFPHCSCVHGPMALQ